MSRGIKILLTMLLAISLFVNTFQSVHAQSAVVHAVLFYSPTCGHCHYVITEILPPLFEKYGDQLQMIGVDVSEADGQAVFFSALEKFEIDLQYAGVPFLIIGDDCLMGSVDIPDRFPGLIEDYLARGGVGWPEIPGLAEMISSIAATQQAQGTPGVENRTPLPSQTYQNTPGTPIATPTEKTDTIVLTGNEDLIPFERIMQDPIGNGLSILVLLGMLAALLGSIWYLLQPLTKRKKNSFLPLMPLLCVLGMGVAGYLSYVEIKQVQAVCGPVGDCNTVQQSEYARLFGILPIGVLGIVGYLAIIFTWLATYFGKGNVARYGAIAMLAMTMTGTIFSIYLTFLEPFIIGATCAWCLSSAVIMTILMVLSLGPGKVAIRRRRKDKP